MAWTTADIPDQGGRVAIVTGANSGIGLYTALELARAGAQVILACRNEDRGREASQMIDQEVGRSATHFMPLDLSNLDSVSAFADAYPSQHERLDLLINNAGVMIPPYTRTTQGFELQFGTNHLGHFALTGLLLQRLLNTEHSRVTTVSSNAHKMGPIEFDDLHWERRYRPWKAYAQSKLANLLFTFELQKRLVAGGHGTRCTAAHPGYTSTNLKNESTFIRVVSPYVGQAASDGALPTLRAATEPNLTGGEYFGPRGPFQLMGHPVKVGCHPRARDATVAAQLWSVSETLTGIRFLS